MKAVVTERLEHAFPLLCAVLELVGAWSRCRCGADMFVRMDVWQCSFCRCPVSEDAWYMYSHFVHCAGISVKSFWIFSNSRQHLTSHFCFQLLLQNSGRIWLQCNSEIIVLPPIFWSLKMRLLKHRIGFDKIWVLTLLVVVIGADGLKYTPFPSTLAHLN